MGTRQWEGTGRLCRHRACPPRTLQPASAWAEISQEARLLVEQPRCAAFAVTVAVLHPTSRRPCSLQRLVQMAAQPSAHPQYYVLLILTDGCALHHCAPANQSVAEAGLLGCSDCHLVPPACPPLLPQVACSLQRCKVSIP